ncbi:MAG: cytochrome c [Acidimicrobiaceae bacterium]|nr:cytochrome c [Acidimicrobiaceae bacterium]MYE97696.1 cytochrome c [Acidimicrobiaceae bacterium]MYI53424.1 cytochrome c [Acidimicrobiaceae bacterium]
MPATSARPPGCVPRFRAVAFALAVAALATGCQAPLPQPSHTGLSARETVRPDPRLAAAGAGIYAEVCSNCHGAGGRGSEWAPALTTMALDVREVAALVRAGVDPPSMPPLAGTLTETEIEAVAADTVELRYSG